ncbi:hypothetical protein [Paenibacillus sp. HW567]|nr:hypothetical protein [Paenibacillus sp. HW567]
MATTTAAMLRDIQQFQQWKAKNHVKQGKAYLFRGAAVMTRGKKRTNKG